MKNKDQILLENLYEKIFQENADDQWKTLLNIPEEELDSYLQKKGMNPRDRADIKNKVRLFRNSNINPLKKQVNMRIIKLNDTGIPYIPSKEIKTVPEPYSKRVTKKAKNIKKDPDRMKRLQNYIQNINSKYRN